MCWYSVGNILQIVDSGVTSGRLQRLWYSCPTWYGTKHRYVYNWWRARCFKVSGYNPAGQLRVTTRVYGLVVTRFGETYSCQCKASVNHQLWLKRYVDVWPWGGNSRVVMLAWSSTNHFYTSYMWSLPAGSTLSLPPHSIHYQNDKNLSVTYLPEV